MIASVAGYITKLKKRKEKKNTIKVNPTIIGCKFLLFCESF
jgi:ribosomal protein S17E